MAAFFYEWDDFGGGYYVGPSAVNQPKNTWQGANITLSNDDATLVPTYGPQQITLTGTGTTSGVISNSTTSTTWSDPTYFNGYCVVVGLTSAATYVYFINTSSGAVQRISLGVVGTSAGAAPVVVPVAGDLVAYVAVGTTAIYQVTRSTSTVASFTPSGNNDGVNDILLTGLTIWNARMIAWGSASDTFLFSDALTFGANWSSLNFVGVGYANDGISYCVPRNLDMIVVKPSGWYSITGILGTSTAVRQMNDTLGILPIDPVAQHNNTVYFVTSTGTNNYAVNLMGISGSRVDVAAYQRFGLADANIRISRTNMGYLAVVAVIEEPFLLQYASVYLLNAQDRWQVMKIPATMEYDDSLKFAVARGQVSRYNTSQDQALYLTETTTGATQNKLALHRLRPTTIEPGQASGTTLPVSATLKLPDLSTKVPTIIKRVYVEAEMLQIPGTSYTGSASMQARVNNKAVANIGFASGTEATSGLSTAYTYPFADFTIVSNTTTSQIRILRFNVDNASYGYLNEIELQFAGLRIRRCWVEGDTQ
jgi:hypothetical protein